LFGRKRVWIGTVNGMALESSPCSGDVKQDGFNRAEGRHRRGQPDKNGSFSDFHNYGRLCVFPLSLVGDADMSRDPSKHEIRTPIGAQTRPLLWPEFS